MSIRQNINKHLQKLEKEYATHNRIEVSKSAILHNLHLFKDLVGKSAIPVLKGNAYGHGIAQVASALKGHELPYVAVDGYFEALRIREVTDQAVLIMGSILPENYKRLKYDNFAFVIHDIESIQALGETGKKVKVHLEVNTGMNRYGAKPDDIELLAKLIQKYKNLELEGVMSHLADSDGDDPATVDTAVKAFDASVDIIRSTGAEPTIIHIAQSAGSLKVNSRYANAFRLGIGLYGINPFPHGHKLHAKLKHLKPALRLISTITKIIELKEGDKVSYNYTFTAPDDMRIGILPLGYYEGVNRGLSNTGTVKINGKSTSIVGRICMNHTMVKLAGIYAEIGDEVVIYSNDPEDDNSINNIAYKHNLFSYSLLTSLSHDMRRKLVE